jgi:hypothetical protein
MAMAGGKADTDKTCLFVFVFVGDGRQGQALLLSGDGKAG